MSYCRADLDAKPNVRSNYRIAAVMVTYNPGSSFGARVRSLVGQVSRLVIVDNGSSAAVVEEIISLEREFPKIELVGLRENRGIAAALNIGLARVVEEGFDWAFTFDHDSQVPEKYCQKMIVSSQEWLESAIVAPRYLDQTTGVDLSVSKDDSSGRSKMVLTTMASGNLVNLAVWADVGMFDESLFIDYVDHEFCLRCAARGFFVKIAEDVTLLHNLGSGRVKKIFGREFFLTNHVALRRYYMVRNRLSVHKKYQHIFPEYISQDRKNLLKQSLQVLLFEENRGLKLHMMLRGLADFLRGRTGRYNVH